MKYTLASWIQNINHYHSSYFSPFPVLVSVCISAVPSRWPALC